MKWDNTSLDKRVETIFHKVNEIAQIKGCTCGDAHGEIEREVEAVKVELKALGEAVADATARTEAFKNDVTARVSVLGNLVSRQTSSVQSSPS